MASAFLLREGTKIDFDSIDLRVRELGFQKDDDRLYLGTRYGNKHIPNEEYVYSMIEDSIGRKSTVTLVAGTNSLFSTMVFKLTSFAYDGEAVLSYTGLDFAAFSVDANGVYTDVEPPVKRESTLFIPAGYTTPITGENVVFSMYESNDKTTKYFGALNSSGVMTIYIESIGQLENERGIFTVLEPVKTTSGLPATTTD